MDFINCNYNVGCYDVGHGVVIANNSHVVKNAEPYSFIEGNPAKLIKFRFTPEQIEKLLHLLTFQTPVKYYLNVCINSSIFSNLLSNSAFS